MKKTVRRIVIGVILLCLCAAGYMIWQVMDIYPEGYTAEQLGIEELYSMRDENGNGTDDYHDFVAGARAYVESGPLYQSIYYAGGYPDDEHGVCTDVIWHAFAHAGYTLKDMVDEDIAADPQAYGIETADPNIDFRRVRNLRVFFDRHALTLDPSAENPQAWQPGDIVIYDEHIALCSDLRNADGFPFILHFDGWGAREADELKRHEVIGHYRWPQE